MAGATQPKVPTEILPRVATWAYLWAGLLYSHSKKRPALDQFVDDALPLVAVNLGTFT